MKAIFVTIISLSIFLLIPVSVFAHVLKTDGSVGAVIHVSPEDDPIADETTHFFFEFKDKEKKFLPNNCDCIGTISQDGKEIYSASLFQNSENPSLEDASFSFVFPEQDIYKVRVSGKPTATGNFEPFSLEWDIRVARETQATEPTSFLPLLIGALVLIFICIYFAIKTKTSKS